MKSLLLAAAALLLAGSPAIAEDVTLEKVHLCCGACLKGAENALTSVEGISDVKCDKDAQKVTFSAPDKKTARAGLRAFAKAGFYGQSSLKFPKSKLEEGATADSATIKGIHLCCAGCTKAVEAALAKVEGVSSVKQQGDKKDIIVTGSKVKLIALEEALHEAGFHGSVGE